MLLVYMSITGNVKNFVERTGLDAIELSTDIEVNDDFILVIPSYTGMVNQEVDQFLRNSNNLKHLLGFASSGNLNFNNEYCLNGRQLSAKYNRPLLFKFEFSGTDKDIADFKKEVYKVETRTQPEA